MCVSMCKSVCVCVCLRERKREREYVCLCVRERERERERGGLPKRDYPNINAINWLDEKQLYLTKSIKLNPI